MKQFFKYFLLSLGVFAGILFVYFLWIAFSWPRDPSIEDINEQTEFEEKCFGDSTSIISPKEQMFCDSMLKLGYSRFNIIHKHYFAKCKQVKNYDRTVLIINFRQDSIHRQPSTEEINLMSRKLMKHFVKKCFTKTELSIFTGFEVNGVVGKEGGGLHEW